MEGKTNYRIVRSCSNCKFAFAKYEYDESTQYFCNKSGDRPKPCGSVAMNESSVDENWAALKAALKVFEKWAVGRNVATNGVCDDYTPGDETV